MAAKGKGALNAPGAPDYQNMALYYLLEIASIADA
jgi:hypothetical protein